MYLSRSTQLDHPFNESSSVATKPLSKLCHNLIHALMCPALTEVGHASQKEGCEGGDQRINISKLLNLMRHPGPGGKDCSYWSHGNQSQSWHSRTSQRWQGSYVLYQSYQMIQATPP